MKGGNNCKCGVRRDDPCHCELCHATTLPDKASRRAHFEVCPERLKIVRLHNYYLALAEGGR